MSRATSELLRAHRVHWDAQIVLQDISLIKRDRLLARLAVWVNTLQTSEALHAFDVVLARWEQSQVQRIVLCALQEHTSTNVERPHASVAKQ